jgi:hypothetical protein
VEIITQISIIILKTLNVLFIYILDYGEIKKENNKKLRLLKLWGSYHTALDYKLVKLN